jgi:hypothetical protein
MEQTKYEMACVDDIAIILVPEGQVIHAAVATVEAQTNETFPDYKTALVSLTDDPSDGKVFFASPSGCCGFLVGIDGRHYDYAIEAA